MSLNTLSSFIHRQTERSFKFLSPFDTGISDVMVSFSLSPSLYWNPKSHVGHSCDEALSSLLSKDSGKSRDTMASLFPPLTDDMTTFA